MRLIPLAIAMLTTAACAVAEGVELKVVRQRFTEAISAFDRFEWRIDLDAKYDNPFDPEEVAVDAAFVDAGDRTINVPAFWMTDREGKESFFAVRFAPPAAGRWTMIVAARDKNGTSRSTPHGFDVKSGKSRGFVRRVEGNPNYFQFDSGDPYFMLGLNLAWANGRDANSYEPWFRDLAANGGNFARVWMCHPNEPTETAKLGPGRYDQAACAFYDTVLATAERHGVYCMVTLNHYRDLRTEDEWGPCRWPHFPYNSVNGGPATRPADFFSDPRAQQLFRQRLRYVVARWSAYSSVAFWELWNEQAYTKVEASPAWSQQMARYLKSIDPNRHLVTTSFGNMPQHEVWHAPEIDLTQEHVYDDDRAFDSAWPISMSSWRHRAFDKPHLVAEFGISGKASDATFDKEAVGTNLHNGVWAGMMSGAAGGASVWWWNDYVARHDLWKTFRGPAAFGRAVDWPRRRFEPVFPEPPVRRERESINETFSDAVLAASGGWGKSHGQLVEVMPNGVAYRTLPHFLYGSGHADLFTPTQLSVQVPEGGGAVVVRVGAVSDAAVLRISVDGEPKLDFPFSALPGAPGQKSTKLHNAGPDDPPVRKKIVHQAVFEKDCELDLPEGRHTIELENLGSDWVWIQSVTLRRVKSSRYAELRVLALYDKDSGEALAWIQDPASNWQSDAGKVARRTIPESELSFRLHEAGDVEYELQWWDTRTGKVTGQDRVSSSDGILKVRVPPVVRDVALRATRAR